MFYILIYCEKYFKQYGKEKAEEMVLKYKDMFGDNFYLEMMLLDFEYQRGYDQFLVEMHLKHGIPMIMSNDVHYAYEEDSKYQTIMMLVNTKRTLAEIEKLKSENADVFDFNISDDDIMFLDSFNENYRIAWDPSNIE